MNRDQANDLVRQTFTQAFDKVRFHNFTLNLLNRLDESKAFTCNSQYVKEAFRGHVQGFERLGTYTSPKNEKLDVLIVHLTHESKLERARTAIRNFVADHLKTRDEKDAALVAFVSPSEKTWRFSYVKMEYATVEKDVGKVGVEAHLTPARRFSYIVGEGESCHTAQTRFLDLLQDTEKDPALAHLEEAFSVEAVTKEFFTKYAELFEKIHKALEKLVVKDKAIGEEFTAKGVNTVDFAKKLMGQIVFLYFLQKKGWLGVARGRDWGSGRRDFLRRLAKGEYGKYGNFFNDILEPLFYDTLATDRGHEAWCNRFECRIPFLNGGLFEPPGDYDWRKTDIILPDRLFTNSEFVEEGITGTGVLDVFDRYNFTVNEAEPLEREVAIDPEMLGKVFENLIEDNRRKGLGAYYTPREIVHYMCQESLINYLDTTLNTRQKSLVPAEPKQARLFGEPEPQQTTLQTAAYEEIVPRSDIETFVHLGEQISHYEAVETAYRIKMPKSIAPNARLIDDKLAEITICDPAVGSGAFPVGMMTEIVRARSALTPYFNDVHERTPYHFKRHAIQNCLYGVDIDAGAVEIAKLRLWLSLVVDEEDVKQIKPLPNLDYKIVAGNSLLGFPFKSQRLVEIEMLKDKLFDETDHAKNARLKAQVDKLLSECFAASKRSLGYEVDFDFEIFFSEVFQREGGFDVVIGNPPWVSNDSIEEGLKTKLRNLYSYSIQSRFDLSCCFVELSLTRLMGNDASAAFVLPEHLWIGEYFVSFRKHTHQHWREVTSLKEGYFDAVNNPASMLIFAKYASRDLVIGKSLPDRSVIRQRQDKEFIETEVQLRSNGREIHTFKVFFDLDYLTLKSRMQSKRNCMFLDKVCVITDGVQTANILSEIMTDKTPSINSHYKKALRKGKSIPCRYGHLAWDGWWILKPEHTRNFKRPGFSYDSPKRMLCFQSAEKIVMRQTEPTIMATIDIEQYYFPNSIFQCIVRDELKHEVSLHYVLGLLNSALVRRYYLLASQVEGTTKPQLYINILKSIPFLKAEQYKQKPIVTLVDRILAAKQRDPKADTTALEREIDQLVYKLYDLTPEEIAIVEGKSE